jgi:hypothetical protein
MRLLCRGYGAAFGPGLLEVVEARQRSVFRTIKGWAREGVPGFARLLAEIDDEDDFADLAYLRGSKAELIRAAAAARQVVPPAAAGRSPRSRGKPPRGDRQAP